jgi:hypothetical protein
MGKRALFPVDEGDVRIPRLQADITVSGIRWRGSNAVL